MTYSVSFTETTNPAKPPISVADGSVNNQTSLTFVGQGYTGFAPVIAGDLLHLLENFANSSSPTNPVEGQLWYDTVSKVVKVFDGTTWNPAGSLKKSGTAPDVANSVAGDLWVDTNNSQLYLFSGSTWILIGPQFSSGTLTGPNVESIVDIANVTHNVVSLYANNYRIAIISKESFTPKATLAGFTTVNQGMTLSTIDASSSTTPTRFWGTATSADALLINNKAVAAANFLRADAASVTNFPLSVRANSGISIGSNLECNLSIVENNAELYNSSGGSIKISLLSNNSARNTVLYLSPESKVGINNIDPASELDVNGLITVSTGINVIGDTDSSAVGIGSIKTAGGISVTKRSNFGGDITTHGKVIVSPSAGGAAIEPGTTGIYDIGSSTKKFNNVWANTFTGDFTGSFTGVLAGSVSGSAGKLASPTVFKMEGDVSAGEGVSFNGQTTNGQLVLQTVINPSLISDKVLATDSATSDLLLVYRAGTGLMKMAKETFLNHVPVMPVGVIMPFAGSVVPAGYLLCDGSEVRISDFPVLYTVIGYTYKPIGDLIGLSTFGLPDLRGRFPLGRDNMDNGRTVPSKNGLGDILDAGGGPANRVTDVTADTLGTGSGSQSVSLTVANLPDHKHSLNSGNAQYYAGGIPGAGLDANAIPGVGIATSTSASGLPNSGGLLSPTSGTAFNTMNPYETINYIIYTGTL